MSVLNVCTTDLDNRISRRYRYRNLSSHQQQQPQQQQQQQQMLQHHHHLQQQQQSPVYRRFSWNYQSNNSTTTDSFDNYSFYTSSSRNSSFEVIFSRLLDALIFTSAIAITAYSYLTGTLIQPFVEAPKPKVLVEYNRGVAGSSNNSSGSHRHHHHHIVDPIEDSKRKRTQEWAEQQVQQPSSIQQREPNSPIPSSKKRSCSSTLLDHKKVQPISRDNMKREKKRTQSLPVNQPPADDDTNSSIITPDEKEDELISRLQSLIQQGQDALSSPVKYKKHSL